ncbi:beta strand repeat-containing protein, partial [Fusobacterium varium]
MISNFSEVEKSLKRCLKEKVSITAATVVGFLIAGTVAFGAVTDVTVKGDADGTIKITGVKETTISDSAGKLTVGDILKEDTTDPIDSLAGLLTVEVNGTAAIIKGNYDNQKETYLGTLSINSGNEQGVTFLTTNEDYTSITSDLKVEVTGQDGKSATAMEAAEEGHTVTNAGTIAVKDYALGMVAGAGATAVNDTNSEITVKGENSSVGMSATTVTGSTTTLTNNGKITVTKGTGISVTGDGEAEVAAGEIEVVAGEVNNIGINIADGTEKATVTGAKITLKGDGKGTGINAGGNVTLKDIAITLSDGATGTGIVYAGGDTEAEAEISTRDIDIKAAGKGIEATMSKAAKSTLNITTGIISTGAGATGITITGAEVADSGTSIATVKTTLGATDGTGVKVAGEKNNTINITLQDTQTPTSKTPISIAKGIDVTSNGDKGIINIDVKQSNLQVAKSGNLVNIGDVAGTTNVDINQNVELVGTGNLVNVGAITGTTNVNINKDIKVATEGTGNIVKAGAITSGTLNINLNVGDKNTTSKSLNVTEGNTALNLANVGDGTTFVKNTGNVTIGKKGILVAGGSTDGAVSLTNQGLIDLKVVDKDNEGKGNSVISSGTGVNVANYGTIKLEINSTDFLAASESEKKDLSELTTEEIKNALKTLGVSDAGTFSNLGYIELTDGKYAAGIELKGGEIYNIDSLKSVLDQPATEVRAFKIKEGDEVTFASEKADDKLSNVNLNIDGKLKIGTDSTVAIANAKDAHILNIGKEGQLTVADNATLNYSGNISADNVVNNNNAAIENNGTLTLANGALNMVAPESKTALLSEPANRVGIELTGAGTTELDNYTVNADIKGTLDGGNALQGTLSAKGKSRITGNVTDINEIKVTDNGMLTFGANSKIIVSGAASGQKTEIDLTNGNMGVEIGEGGANVLKKSEEKIKFTGTKGVTPNELDKGKVVLLTNALTENTTFNLGTHDGLKDGDIIANGDIYYNITQGNGGIWNATFNKDGLIDK